MDHVLTQLAGYVESVAGKDDTLITSAGMEVKGSRSAPTLPSVPEAVSASAGEHEGEINLVWRAVANARNYTIEATQDPATGTSCPTARSPVYSNCSMSAFTRGSDVCRRI